MTSGTDARTDRRVARSRAAVMQTAADLLLEGGTSAVTIEAVVRRSGVARSTIYRHWPTRGEVVAAAFAHLMPPTPEPPERGGVAERLRAVVLPKVEEMGTVDYVAVIPSLLAQAANDPELQELREQFVHRQRAPLAAVLTEAIDRGELAPDIDVDRSCAQLLGPALFHRMVLGRPHDPDLGPAVLDAFLRQHGTGPT